MTGVRRVHEPISVHDNVHPQGTQGGAVSAVHGRLWLMSVLRRPSAPVLSVCSTPASAPVPSVFEWAGWSRDGMIVEGEERRDGMREIVR